MSELLAYHERTKHSPRSVMSSGHRLDWSNKPLPFKIYRDLEAVDPPPDIDRLCLLSNGVLRWRRHGPESAGFRAAACTGALYHVELHLATAGRDDLPAGLYHYGAHDGRLRRLRQGDARGALLRATGGYEPIAGAPLVFILTSTYWRNAWKYRARAYRHVWWDGGAVVANLLAVMAAHSLPASVVMGFADDEVNHLLGVDGEREAATAIVVAGEGAGPPPVPGELPEIDPPTEPLSPRELRFPAIEQAHRASSLESGDRAAAWRGRWPMRTSATGHTVPPPVTDRDVEAVIRSRRSARAFGRQPLRQEQLERLLQAALAPIPGDAFASPPIEPFLIANAVDGRAPGAYDADLRPIRLADLRPAAADLALWQDLAADAAANVYFLADLDALIEQAGERACRVAQILGGIYGERLELAATAMDLAATGLTFFDDAVTRFFEPAARGRQVIYLAALGSRP